jgi:polyisoprenoid-binding protein YceI
MMLKKACSILACFAAAAGVLSCAAAPPATTASPAPVAQAGSTIDLKATYNQLGAAGGKVMTLDSAASTVRIYVFRAGQAAKVGHNHVLSPPRFTGYFHLPASGAAAARFDLEFRLDQLEIDNPAYRATLGPAFASPVSADAVEAIRKHMLGNDNMQADRFPLVRVHSVEIAGEAPRFAAKVQFEMHGQTREFWIPLNVEGLPERLSVSGAVVLRQTDFGVVPFSLLGGLIAVKDEVVVEFKLVGA